MAYSAEPHRATGFTVTAAIYNQAVSDNPAAIYAGAMSIASQAANDLPYFSSTSQIGRVAATASAVLTTNGSSVPSLKVGSVYRTYAVTLANVINTALKTTYASFTIPASLIADGDQVVIVMPCLVRNAVGAVTADQYVVFGGATEDHIGSFSFGYDGVGNEKRNMHAYTLQRVGADLWVVAGVLPSSTGTFNATSDEGINKIVAPDFTVSTAVTLKLTFDTADSTVYVKPQSAICYHLRP